MSNVFVTIKLRTWAFLNGIKSPHLSFAALLAGLASISEQQSDYTTLFGHDWGPKVYVLTRWFARFCIAVAAYGHLNLPDLGSRSPEAESRP